MKSKLLTWKKIQKKSSNDNSEIIIQSCDWRHTPQHGLLTIKCTRAPTKTMFSILFLVVILYILFFISGYFFFVILKNIE